jgi:hypothetical protein
MSRGIEWDILLGEYDASEVNLTVLLDRFVGITEDFTIGREKIIDWNGGLFGFLYQIDLTNVPLQCGTLYRVRMFDKWIKDYEKIDEEGEGFNVS